MGSKRKKDLKANTTYTFHIFIITLKKSGDKQKGEKREGVYPSRTFINHLKFER